MAESGASALLQQAHRNNWLRYLAALEPGARRSWDVCVLTASDERQAAGYRRHLAWRQEAGLLPLCTRFLVLPDPPGCRIGSGGATLAALAQVYADQPDAGRILVIHSGGNSKRLPHCAAAGKLFARIPRTLPDGRASTVFDEFMISLSGLAGDVPPGALIASGDVLLVFDHLQLSLRHSGVTGVAAAAPAHMGARHGVYVTDGGSHAVRAYLHKPRAEELRRWNAVAADGTVQIDTGLVWLPAVTTQRYLQLAGQQTVAGTHLNLYSDLLLPLAASTTIEKYLDDSSDGPVTGALQAARRLIWRSLNGTTTLHAELLQPAVFVHFGTSAEYWRMAATDAGLAELCGWAARTASWVPPEATRAATGHELVLINALVEKPAQQLNSTSSSAGPDTARSGGEGMAWTLGVDATPAALVTDSNLGGTFTWHGPAIVAGVQTQAALSLAPGMIVSQVPVDEGWLTEVFGLADDPKQPWDGPAATYNNRLASTWLAAAGLPAEALWSGVEPYERTLWNARLFPIAADRETSLRLALPLYDPVGAAPDWASAWLFSERLSMAEVAARVDGERLLNDVSDIEDQVAGRQARAAIEAEQPAEAAVKPLGTTPGATLARRSTLLAKWLASGDATLQLRGYRVLAMATGDQAWDDRAFAVLAGMIEGQSRGEAGLSSQPQVLKIKHTTQNHMAIARAAARIDFGGGWTDTPPHSIERGGVVLNAAITLRGQHPVVAEGAWLPKPELRLESRDLGATLAPQYAGEILAHADPSDPFALLKAALVLRRVVPPDSDPDRPLADILTVLGGGLRLATSTAIPRGSGLGASSIMAGAVLECLDQLLEQRSRSCSQLFADVLRLEQMLTTGGGWQDQAGGLVGGIKLLTTVPGLPQNIQVARVELDPQVAAELTGRLVLVYTGQQRLAKNILRSVMGRWMARDPEMVWLLAEIGRLAHAMGDALRTGDVDGFGHLIGEHWELNKRMDPGCTNPFIDGLFDLMRPYVSGAKLGGAGGGGFTIAIARSQEARQALDQALAARFPGTPVAIWPCAIPDEGIKVETTTQLTSDKQ